MAPHAGPGGPETGLEGPPEDAARKIREQARKQQPCPLGEQHVYHQLLGADGKPILNVRDFETPEGERYTERRIFLWCQRCGMPSWSTIKVCPLDR